MPHVGAAPSTSPVEVLAVEPVGGLRIVSVVGPYGHAGVVEDLLLGSDIYLVADVIIWIDPRLLSMELEAGLRL